MREKIIGFDGYEVSTEGVVYSLKYGKERVLKGFISPKGYKSVCLSIGNSRNDWRVHRLVARAFLSDYSEELEVNHIDCDRGNNRLDNLEMCTRLQNQRHAKEMGRYKTGVKHPNTKLTIEDVKKIRNSPLSQRVLAATYGVHQSSIWHILAGITWTHI